jgi:serine phosphatase RsbU (regulator of sigma subunit)
VIVARPPARGWRHELQQAAAVQQQLTPQQVELPGLEVAVRLQPLLAVGGDYVDVVPMPDGRVLLALGDVCGNGLAAALVASSLHGIVRSCISDGHDVGTVAQRLNDYVGVHFPDGPFVTLACAAIDPASGQTESLNAGHPPPLVFDAAGSVRRLKAGKTFPIGITDIDTGTKTDLVPPGDVVLLVSDGWTESVDSSGRMLGLKGLIRHASAVLSELRDASLDAVLRELESRVAQFQGPTPAQDDRALMLIRRRG